MTLKKKLLTFFLFTHLLCIISINLASMSHFDERLELPEKSEQALQLLKNIPNNTPSLLSNFFNVYSIYTGITGYSFFSPDPPNAYQVFIDRKDEEQKTHRHTLEFTTAEARSRASSTLDIFRELKNDTLKNLMIRSIAARFYEFYPSSTGLSITTAYYDVPSMEQYQSGQLPKHEKHYTYEINLR